MSSTNVSSLTILFINLNNFTSYFQSIIFIIGIIGNCLDVVLFSRPKFRTVSCCIYFLAAAVSIIIQFVFTVCINFYGRNYTNSISSTIIICKILTYIQQSTAMIQRWLITAASFDRYACSSTNANLRRFATVRVARYMILAIVIIWLIIPIYRFIFYSIKENTCDLVGSYVIALINSVYTAVGGVIIPLVVMIPSLLLLQHNLHQKRKRHQVMFFQKQTRKNATQQLERKRDQQVLVILIVQIIVYCILIMPSMIVQIYDAITLFIPKSIDRIIIEQFLDIITGNILVAIYSAVPFYLNTMTSKMFRNELMIVIRSVFCWKWLKKTNQVKPTSNDMPTKTLVRKQHIAQGSMSKTMAPINTRLESTIKANTVQIIP